MSGGTNVKGCWRQLQRPDLPLASLPACNHAGNAMAKTIMISSSESLEAWLDGRLAAWAQALAMRVARRFVPFGGRKAISRHWRSQTLEIASGGVSCAAPNEKNLSLPQTLC